LVDAVGGRKSRGPELRREGLSHADTPSDVPSGDYIFFASNKLGFTNFEIYIVDMEGRQQPVRVTFTDGFDGLPVPSPDGTKLSWTSNRGAVGGDGAQIYIADWNHERALEALAASPLRGAESEEH